MSINFNFGWNYVETLPSILKLILNQHYHEAFLIFRIFVPEPYM